MDGMRIGELAGRVGVSTDRLRVWERRHHLFTPTRTQGGYRIYTAGDETRARRVLALQQSGVPLADAVARVLGDAVSPAGLLGARGRTTSEALVDRVDRAVTVFDAVEVNAALDEAVDLLGLSTGLSEVAVGYLQRLGEQWASGRVGIAHEHFASHLVRRRIGDLLLQHPADGRPTAVLACPPSERHDIGLLVAAVLLSHDGWCIRFLGADTPLASTWSASEALDPSLVILSATRRTALLGSAGAIRRLSRRWPLGVGGRGADADVAEALGAHLLPEDVAQAPLAAEAILGEQRHRLHLPREHVSSGVQGGAW